jgi:hypothetical protein
VNAPWWPLNSRHKARNDAPGYDDLKPNTRDLPADYGTHPLWCHRSQHDGPCVVSTAVTDPHGVRVKVTVSFDRDTHALAATVDVGGRSAVLDRDKANSAVLLIGSWLAPTSLPHTRAEVD